MKLGLSHWVPKDKSGFKRRWKARRRRLIDNAQLNCAELIDETTEMVV